MLAPPAGAVDGRLHGMGRSRPAANRCCVPMSSGGVHSRVLASQATGCSHCYAAVDFNAGNIRWPIHLAAWKLTASLPSWTGGFSPEEQHFTHVVKAAPEKYCPRGSPCASRSAQASNPKSPQSAASQRRLLHTNNIKKPSDALLTPEEPNSTFLVTNSARSC